MVVLALVAVYVFWVAGRIDRSHARATAAHAALDAHLVRRAAAAVEAADPLGDPQLRWAGRVALEAGHDERESAENDLTRVLRPALLASHDMSDELTRASRRVALARQVHNDLVRDALALRRRRVVRVLRLARKHPVPRYFDIDDPQA